VGPALLVHCLVAGGSFLALWLYVRLGARRPRSRRSLGAHIVLAGIGLVVTPLAVGAIVGPDPSPGSAGIALFAVFLPAMTYAFLAALFLIEHLQRSLYAR
jgi:hypothetical protein